MPNWASGNRCWMACAIMCAPVCQKACLPSGESNVRISSSQSFSKGVRRSTASPSTLAAQALLYRPMPMLFATSAGETPGSNSFTAPPFNVTLIISKSSFFRHIPENKKAHPVKLIRDERRMPMVPPELHTAGAPGACHSLPAVTGRARRELQGNAPVLPRAPRW